MDSETLNLVFKADTTQLERVKTLLIEVKALLQELQVPVQVQVEDVQE